MRPEPTLPNKNPEAETTGTEEVKIVNTQFSTPIPLITYEDVARHYGMTREREEYIGTCPLCAYPKPTFAVRIHPSKLILCCMACQDNRRLFTLVVETIRSGKLPAPPSVHPATVAITEQHLKRQQWATDIYQQAVPISGTLAEVYFHSRGFAGCNPEDTSKPSWLPPVLRFHPNLWYSPTEKYPAIISPVTTWDGEFLAIHRTYLAPDGKGKAPTREPRKILGNALGGSVHLAPAESTLGLAEGLETALAAMCYSSEPVWACLSISGLMGVVLPPLPLAETVLIFADHDESGAGFVAARKAALRLMGEGRRVEIIAPRDLGDFCDLLTQGRIES